MVYRNAATGHRGVPVRNVVYTIYDGFMNLQYKRIIVGGGGGCVGV